MVNLKHIGIIVFTILTLGCSTPPPDKAMQDHFHSHEADFIKLVSMMKEDANLYFVDGESAYLKSSGPGFGPKADLSPGRIDEYRRLLKLTGVKNILLGDGVHFGYWGGWVGIDPTNSQAKDYMFSEVKPSPLTDSLDEKDKLPALDPSSPSAYKKIAENWYIEYTETD